VKPREVLLFVAISGMIHMTAKAAVYVVSPDPIMGDYPTIQAAIDAAVGGDVIELMNGTFVGPGNRDMDFLGKAIRVRSQSGDPASCVIDCQGSPAEHHRAFYFHSGETSAAQVRQITVQNGYAPLGGAIHCSEQSSPTIIGCIFSNNEASGDGGAIYLQDWSATAVDQCWFEGNSAVAGGAVGACFHASPSFAHCTFVGNGADRGGGLFL
jgi:hypothetical protein